MGSFRQWMFRTDTAGTPTLIKRVRRASVSAVPAKTTASYAVQHK
ncbi:hypothetical protein [Polaromonas sp. CG9_12]|nr:hypothetical protein [Polaromonas sp. CG9_12]